MRGGDSFSAALQKTAQDLEEILEILLQAPCLSHEIFRPPLLLEAMRYALLGGGKRLRPFLVCESAKALGYEGAGALRVSAAVEMVHTYSLVHDDLPAMDNDDVRRGRLSVHKVYGEALAILVGDALLTYAFDVLASPETHNDPHLRLSLITHLARAAGPGGMVGGQALDMLYESSKPVLTQEDIAQMQAMKTGALFRFSVEAGACLAQASPAHFQALTHYGTALGRAFQIADDLLDLEGEEVEVGKKVHKDAARGKATFVSYLGKEESQRQLTYWGDQALCALAPSLFDERADHLRALVAFTLQRSR